VNDSLTSGHQGFISGFEVRNFEMLRNALILEDPAYRAEVRQYGDSIISTPHQELTLKENIVGQWLFSSRSADQIGEILFIKKSTVGLHVDNIARKILQLGIEQSRFNLCAALLSLGFLDRLQNESSDFTCLEKYLTSDSI
jgi:DNA-binding CsgD family transcriptional regulator